MQRKNKQFEEILRRIRSKSMDLTERRLRFGSGMVAILYVRQLTDRVALAEQVIKPLMECDKSRDLTAADVVESVIFADDCQISTDTSQIERHVLEGMTVLLFSEDSQYVIINLKQVEKRNTTEPVMTYTVRGPRDSLVENLDSNLSLIRYRLQCEALRIDMLRVGPKPQQNRGHLF